MINEKLLTKKIKTLWSGSTSTTSTTINLNESIENYDFILIGVQASNAWSYNSELIPTNQIVYHDTNDNSSDTYDITIIQSPSVYSNLQMYFKTNTKIRLRSETHSGWGNSYLKYVIGIKL